MSLGLIDHSLYKDHQLRIEYDPINPGQHILYIYTGDYTDELKYDLRRGGFEEIAITPRDRLETSIDIFLGNNFLENIESRHLTADSIGLASLHAYNEEQRRNSEYESRKKVG